MLQYAVFGPLFKSLLLDVPLVVLDACDRSVNRESPRVPVEFAEVLEELAENVNGCLKLIVEVVEEEDDQNVEGVCRHVGSMRAEKGGVKRQPTLEHQDRLLEKVPLPDSLGELLYEVKSEESTELSDRDVNRCASDFEFDHKRIGLVDKVDAGQVEL